MLFPTAVFALFFIVVFGIYWTLAPASTESSGHSAWIRKALLLAASLFFYGYWNWKFSVMLLASALVNDGIARWIERSEEQKARHRVLVLGLVSNLVLLAFFKYAEFLFFKVLVPVIRPIAERFYDPEAINDFLYFADSSPASLISRIVLPIGISFYTFSAISYLVDVYRRQIKPAATTLDFANYLTFFPKIFAGPIVRAGDLLPAMEHLPGRDTRIDSGRAGFLILGGLFKKIVIANWLGTITYAIFENPEASSSLDVLFGVYGYAIQIYCDFSAYSDMAIGLAMLLGFRFPDNFRAPYFSSTLRDFWRRWHISLSSWLRDYLYIPFGGSRCSRIRTSWNMMLTFLLGGLWHGAGWNFILWGGIHGAYLAIERPFLPKKGMKSRVPARIAPLVHFLSWVIVFHVVCAAWVFFNSESLDTVTAIFHQLFHGFGGSELWTFRGVLVLLVGFGTQLLDIPFIAGLESRFTRLHPIVQGAVFALLMVMILGLGPTGVASFIYFGF